MYTVHFMPVRINQWLRDRTDEAIKTVCGFTRMCRYGRTEMVRLIPLNGSAGSTGWNPATSWITWSVSDKDETCSVLKKTARFGSEAGRIRPEGVRDFGPAYLRQFNTTE